MISSPKFRHLMFVGAAVFMPHTGCAKKATASNLQAVIIETSITNYKSGTVFNIGDPIEIPKNEFVRVMFSSGQVIKLPGPLNQPFGENMLTSSASSQKTNKTKKLFALLSKREDSTTLVVRSLTAETSKNFQDWDPFVMQIPFSGNFCILPETKITLSRKGSSSGDLEFNIVADDTVNPVVLKKGKNVSMQWPKDIQQTGAFSMHTSGAAPWFISYDFQIKSVDKLDAPTLLSQQCETQLVDFLSLEK